MAFIQPDPDSERQVQTERCSSPADGQLSYFEAHSLLISGRQHSKSSTGTATNTVNTLGVRQTLQAEEGAPGLGAQCASRAVRVGVVQGNVRALKGNVR